jgi:hypothetical protein
VSIRHVLVHPQQPLQFHVLGGRNHVVRNNVVQVINVALNVLDAKLPVQVVYVVIVILIVLVVVMQLNAI